MKVNTRLKKLCLVILSAILVVIIITWIDGERVKAMKRPIFVVQTATYQDGGSLRLSGLGYTVVKLNRIMMVDLGGGEYREHTQVGYTFEHWALPIDLRVTDIEKGATYTK